MPLRALVYCQLGRAPGKGNPASAVSVIVDDQFVANLLGGYPEARGPVRTESDDGANLPISRDVNRRKGTTQP